MTYYNRKVQLYNTLNSINNSKYKDNIQIIIVDDCSSDEHKLNLYELKKINNNIELYILKDEDKWYINPCIPYNIGFNKIKYDNVIIQNSECYHNGDIIEYIINNLTIKTYLSFSCYSLKNNQDINIVNIENRSVTFDGDNGWYNHSIYRPTNYHFCSAIKKENLTLLGGFDERFANGIGYDDNEFLIRIDRIKLIKSIIDIPHVFHQYHYNNQPNLKTKTYNTELYNHIQTETWINPNKKQ
jgi:GT2 family glycosyltransferase